MIRYSLVFVLCFALPGGWSAQEVLTYEDALLIALEKNYDLRISANMADIAANNNTAGNAGFLPSLIAGADANRAIRDSRLTFFDGRTIEADQARSDQINSFVSLDWTLFDGMKMFATRNKLREFEVLGKLELQFQFEQVALALAEVFYRLVQEEKLREVYQSTLDVSRMRFRIERRAFELGGSSELQKLNAEVDMNADSAQVMQHEMLLKNLKAELNLILGRSPETEFIATAGMQPGAMLDYNQLKSGLRTNNASMLAARSRSRISKEEITEVRASYMPTLGLFADFTRNRQENEVGILQNNLTTGPNVGLSLRWNLFNGLNDRREIDNRKIMFENAALDTERIEAEASTALLQHYNEYTFARKLLALEEGSLTTAQRNLQVAVETYRLGAINAIEFRTIQKSELEAEARLLQAEYLVKVAEMRLKVLAGSAKQ